MIGFRSVIAGFLGSEPDPDPQPRKITRKRGRAVGRMLKIVTFNLQYCRNLQGFQPDPYVLLREAAKKVIFF